jgi:TonB family protein
MSRRLALRRLVFPLCLGALLPLLPTPAAAEATQPAIDPAETLLRAQSLLREGRPQEALDLARQVAASSEADTAREARFLVCWARAALPETPLSEADVDSEVKRIDRGPSIPDAVSRPEILSRTQPQYTEAARKSGIEGRIILESIIDEEGCVINIKVLQSLDPGLDEATKAALRSWTFQPAMYKGMPVKVYYSLTINFAIEKKPTPKPY